VAKFAAIVAVLAFGISGAGASAQSLQRLTVTDFTLSSSTATPKLEVPFRLIITARVNEHVTELEYLDLPILAQLELLGDERRLSSGPSGTVYTETIDAVAHHTGTITIAPATLDAIDPHDGKPKQYASNSLVLHVVGAPLQPPSNASLGDVARALERLFFILLTLAALVTVIVLLLRRPPRPVLQTVPAAPPPPPADPLAQLRDALTTLRVDRTRATAMRVRAVARRLVGASETETLGDVLRRPLAGQSSMRDLLIALERAAFTYEEDLQTAIDGAIARLERLIAS
jgi:hypothetical protein